MAFFQKIRTFVFSSNRTCPKNPDFCVFAKQDLSEKSGLSPKTFTHASPDFKRTSVVQLKYENLPESLSIIEALLAIAHLSPWPSNILFLIFHTQILGRAVYPRYKTNMPSVPQMSQGPCLKVR